MKGSIKKALAFLTCASLFFSIENCSTSVNIKPVVSNPTFVAQSHKDTIRDWARYPAIVEIDTQEDIIAVSDPHADYDRLVNLLQAAKVIKAVSADPEQVKWNAGKSILVCVGDLIDKWNQGLKVIKLFQTLQTQAHASGGQVIVTMGNHEDEFLADPTIDKAADFVAELKAQGIYPSDVASGKHPLGQYLRSLPFGVRTGKWFFIHSGNTNGNTIKHITSKIEDNVNQDGFGANYLLKDDSILESKLDPPWWESVGGNPESVLKSYTDQLGVAHIVMGHQNGKIKFSDGTIRPEGTIFQKFGRIFMIDVGMSRGIDRNQGQLLRITNKSGNSIATAVSVNGQSTVLWNGK